jgi:hypothetical protein
LARSQPPSAPSAEAPPPGTGEGTLKPTGVGLSAFALASTLGGVGLRTWGTNRGGGDFCGLDGCFERPNHHARVAGAGLIGGGIGIAAVALPVTLAAYLGDPPSEPRQSDALMAAGVMTTATAVGLFGGTVGALAELGSQPLGRGTHANLPGDHPKLDVATPFGFVVSGALLATGIPMWAIGGRAFRPDQDEVVLRSRPDGTPEPQVTIDNSPGMTSTGIGLTFGGLGLAVIGAAVGVASASGGGEFAGLGGLLTGLAVGGPAVLATLTGIPLWIAGEWDIDVPADSIEALEQRDESASVDVQLGMGSLAVEGRF